MCWFFCFFKQKTAYVMRIRDWSSDVCSSDLARQRNQVIVVDPDEVVFSQQRRQSFREAPVDGPVGLSIAMPELDQVGPIVKDRPQAAVGVAEIAVLMLPRSQIERHRSEEHTSELQSLMRISYAVFCLKKKKKQ